MPFLSIIIPSSAYHKTVLLGKTENENELRKNMNITNEVFSFTCHGHGFCDDHHHPYPSLYPFPFPFYRGVDPYPYGGDPFPSPLRRRRDPCLFSSPFLPLSLVPSPCF